MAWMLGRAPRQSSQLEVETAAPKGRGRTMTGPYVPLYAYLEGRYADSVVLTFAEMGDLLGFPLPDAASRSSEWWTQPNPDPSESRYDDSWVLSHRTAMPNLPARVVVFARVAAHPTQRGRK